ncbi:hypothetical protein Btru_022190 [Bulinus truncatus]|nr:hypothetical protein Btru_022190 [Bulinus truncatus]
MKDVGFNFSFILLIALNFFLAILLALRAAKDNGLSFESPLLAVYHFRKYGPEFPKYIARFGDHIDVYLGPDRTVRKLYATKEDYFGVVTSTASGQKISTMYRNHGRSQEFTRKLVDYFKDSPDQPGTVSDAAQRLARFLGLRSFQVYITVNGKKTLATDGTVMDPEIQKEIAHFLNAITI